MFRSVLNVQGQPIKKLDTIYIGYDAREQRATEVLINSIERHASRPLNVVTINADALRRVGLYRRAPHIDSTVWADKPVDHMKDAFDGRPFSTDFSFTRFLIPFLNQMEGLAVFMDCDMYFRSDPCRLFDEYAEPESYAIRCVQHQYDEGGQLLKKMYGCPQTSYSRKNWSSFVLYNCSHPAHHNLTVDDINTKPGNWLHNFRWLDDDVIGDLPEEWNWLDGHSPHDVDPINVHFTTGGPWFSQEAGLGYNTWQSQRPEDRKYCDEWLALSKELDRAAAA